MPTERWPLAAAGDPEAPVLASAMHPILLPPRHPYHI